MTEPLDLDAIIDAKPEWTDAETIARLRAVIHGQGLSIAAMSKEIRERDAEIARLRAPPGADALEQRHEYTARALQQYGDERAVAAIREQQAELGWLLQDAAQNAALALENAIQIGQQAAREAREAAIEEAARAAKGYDAERITTHDAAAAYLVGRLDAAGDVRALAARPGSES